MMNVIMKSPVTSTAASDARNSPVVSFGLSSDFFSFFVAATELDPGKFPSLHGAESAVPPGDLKNVRDSISKVKKFITHGWSTRQIVLQVSYRPINKERASYDVFTRHKPPIAAVIT